MAIAIPTQQKRAKTKTAVIDCDIHNGIARPDALDKYLSKRWQDHHATYGKRGQYPGMTYPRLHPNAGRDDAWPPTGGPPGSDLPFMQKQLLDEWQIEYGILNTLGSGGSIRNAEYSAAISTAYNEWLIEEWLEPEPRLRASIVVPYEAPELAAQEIERRASDKRFVQAILVARTEELLGRRKYWPMYEAAEKHDLPIGIHFGGTAGWPITGAGQPSFYFEDHVGMPQAFQPQIISFIYEGVFERFPNLKIVLIEGGFAWLPSLMWRMDRSWELMRDEVPHVKKPPSEYLRENFWITTQPIEEPPRPHQFHELLAHLDMNDRFLFATDYPHWDFDAPDRALPSGLPDGLKEDFLAGNARRFYQLA
ncbi:MAG: amidohydrolase family protein [Chloroflexota bacterium]